MLHPRWFILRRHDHHADVLRCSTTQYTDAAGEGVSPLHALVSILVAATRTPPPTPPPTPTAPVPVPALPAPLLQLGRVLGWTVHHPRPLLAVALLAGAVAGWSWLRRLVARRWKKALPGLAGTTWRLLRLAVLEEDRRWRAGYTLGLLAAVVTGRTGPGGWGSWSTGILVGLLGGRSAYVAFRRRRFAKQLFDIAADICKYPKDAQLHWRRWIRIRWTGPGGPRAYRWVDIRWPAKFDSANEYYQKKLIRQLNTSISRTHVWEFDWRHDENRVRVTPVSPVPTEAALDGIEDEQDWQKIRAGKIVGGRDLIIDLGRFHHVFIGGPTGTGKSVEQRVFAAQLMPHRDKVRIVGFDPLGVELGWLEGKPGVEVVAGTLQAIAEGCERLITECQRRQLQMTNEGANHYLLLAQPPPAVAVFVDELTECCATSKRKSLKAEVTNDLKTTIADALEELARIGRKFGIHLIVATQRPEVRLGVSGNLMTNMGARILTGRTTRRASLMILESTYGTKIPTVPGRRAVVLGVGSDPIDVQGYMLDQVGLQQLPFIDVTTADAPVLEVLQPPPPLDRAVGDDHDPHDDGDDSDSDGEPPPTTVRRPPRKPPSAVRERGHLRMYRGEKP